MPNSSAMPERHVGVAGEVEIDLEGEAQRRLPGLGHGDGLAGGGRLEHRVDVVRRADRRGTPSWRGPTHEQHQAARRSAPPRRGARRARSSNWCMISLQRTSGPARTCGKKRDVEGVADEVVARRAAGPRSARYMMWWKVKNEMPSGSAHVEVRRREARGSGWRDRRRSSRYLKTPSTTRFSGDRERDQDAGAGRQEGARPRAS